MNVTVGLKSPSISFSEIPTTTDYKTTLNQSNTVLVSSSYSGQCLPVSHIMKRFSVRKQLSCKLNWTNEEFLN